MRPSNNLENKTPSDIYWRVLPVYIKVQTHSSLEIKTGRYYLFNHLGSYRNYMQFQLSSTRENKSRLEFLGKF